MNISLTPELEKFVEERVESGFTSHGGACSLDADGGQTVERA